MLFILGLLAARSASAIFSPAVISSIVCFCHVFHFLKFACSDFSWITDSAAAKHTSMLLRAALFSNDSPGTDATTDDATFEESKHPTPRETHKYCK